MLCWFCKDVAGLAGNTGNVQLLRCAISIGRGKMENGSRTFGHNSSRKIDCRTVYMTTVS